MTRTIALALDQLYRPQPGGIGTYVRGLVRGLAAIDDPSNELVGVVPWAKRARDVDGLALRTARVPLPVEVLSVVWGRVALGVPRHASVVHATSMAGPFAGGRADAIHSVAMHDMLWRDESSATTSAGVRFHEARLALLRRRDDVRILTTSPGLDARLVEEGFARARLHPVRLGIDDGSVAVSSGDLAGYLARVGVNGPYTFYAGTREPRKNIERLVAAHRVARSRAPELGPLVLAGPTGWGEVPTGDAVVLGLVERSVLKALYRDATLFAYVPLAEGWGLPPVEALGEGTRVVASSTTPSVADNAEVVIVDPLDLDAIVDGFVRAVTVPVDELSVQRRRSSVTQLTWRQCALDHLASWR